MYQNVDVALDEMRRALDTDLHAGDMLDQKAAMAVNGAGLIIALFAGLQATLGAAVPKPPVFWILLGLAALLCIIMFIATQTAAWPRTYMLPIKSDWQVLSDTLFVQEAEPGLLKLLSGYVTQIQHNKAINAAKARRLRLALILLPVIIALLVIAAMFA